MGILGSLTKGALAKKVIDEGRKPENQRKIKNAISSLRGGKSSGKSSGKVGGRGGRTAPRRGTRG